MRKLSLFLVALLVTLLVTNGAYCAEGDELTTNSFRVDSNGQIYYKDLVETILTSDTITTAESGKNFFVLMNAGEIEMTLPAAAAGLNYRITALKGNTAGGETNRIYIDPADADYINGCVGAGDGAAMAAGDSIYSNSTTGDSVKLIATNDTTWICVDKSGTWSDGGTEP